MLADTEAILSTPLCRATENVVSCPSKLLIVIALAVSQAVEGIDLAPLIIFSICEVAYEPDCLTFTSVRTRLLERKVDRIIAVIAIVSSAVSPMTTTSSINVKPLLFISILIIVFRYESSLFGWTP